MGGKEQQTADVLGWTFYCTPGCWRAANQSVQPALGAAVGAPPPAVDTAAACTKFYWGSEAIAIRELLTLATINQHQALFLVLVLVMASLPEARAPPWKQDSFFNGGPPLGNMLRNK
ncbi:hypothetical protein TrVGV298_004534 [Trichoderma virens]|nr:hypothetical protein TrVGV298_004534 [Trichoderma virens]